MLQNDLVGQTFNKLTVIKKTDKKIKRNVLWLCKCECGNEKLAQSYQLKNGLISSCGCLKNNHRKLTGWERTRSIHSSMKSRCNIKDLSIRTKHYAQKGIFVCDEWKTLKQFIIDMGLCPPNYTLDRIDNSKGYFKQNCRWVPYVVQAMNRVSSKRKNSKSIYKGVSKRRDNQFIVMLTHKYIGSCKTEKEAGLLYNKTVKEKYGDYAFLNEVKTNDLLSL